MAPRPRKRGNRDLPDNLYQNATGYYYKHPVTKRNHGMGSNRAEAIKAAKILNQRLTSGAADLVSRVVAAETIADVVGRFRREYLPEKKLAVRTLSEIEIRLRRIERELGSIPFTDFDLAALSEWLRPMTRDSYIKSRQLWIDVCRFTCSIGLSERNIAELTLKKAPAERVRKRWTLEQYKAMREQAEPWLRVALDLALISLQRREDLVNMRFDAIENGRLKVTQHKTGKPLAIKMGESFNDVLRAARDRTFVCPYIVARLPAVSRIGKKKHAFQVLPNYLSAAVAAARDATGLFDDYAEGERPTLHEIRSLGAHLYREAGFADEYIQALLGHENRAMTEVYLDGHKEVWEDVSADLRVDF